MARGISLLCLQEAYCTGDLPGSHGATVMMPPRPDQPVTHHLHHCSPTDFRIYTYIYKYMYMCIHTSVNLYIIHILPI